MVVLIHLQLLLVLLQLVHAPLLLLLRCCCFDAAAGAAWQQQQQQRQRRQACTRCAAVGAAARDCVLGVSVAAGGLHAARAALLCWEWCCCEWCWRHGQTDEHCVCCELSGVAAPACMSCSVYIQPCVGNSRLFDVLQRVVI